MNKIKELKTKASYATVKAEIFSSELVELDIDHQVFELQDIDELCIFLLDIKRKLLKKAKKEKHDN